MAQAQALAPALAMTTLELAVVQGMATVAVELALDLAMITPALALAQAMTTPVRIAVCFEALSKAILSKSASGSAFILRFRLN